METTPFKNLRVDHNGSLVAPAWLSEAFHQFAEHRISEQELRVAQDRAIADVIAK